LTVDLGRKLTVEFIGTFLFIFAIGMAVTNAGDLAPLAIGAALMVMVYAGGHISGGHYNPAVSLGVLLRGRLEVGELIPYWMAQVAAAIAAGFVYILALERGQAPELAGSGTMLIAEFLFTFALVWVVLHTATSSVTEGNSYYGLAIGFTVAAGAFAVGALSGGAFNPGVAIGTMVMGLLEWADIWVYLVANLAGAIVAALAFRYVNPTELVPPEEPAEHIQ
jgi:aquaporin Z